MIKNLQDAINSKGRMIDDLRNQQEEAASNRKKAEAEIERLTLHELEIKNKISGLESNEEVVSVESVLADWIAYRDEYNLENIQPVINEIKASKKKYLEASHSFVESTRDLDGYRKRLMSLLEKQGASNVDLNKFNTATLRFPSYLAELLEIDTDNHSLQALSVLLRV